jgi:hypothetical protein
MRCREGGTRLLVDVERWSAVRQLQADAAITTAARGEPMTTVTTTFGIGTRVPGIILSAFLVALLAVGVFLGARTFTDSRTESPAAGVLSPAAETAPGLSVAEEVQMVKAASASPRDLAPSVAEEVQMVKAASASPRDLAPSVAEEVQMMKAASSPATGLSVEEEVQMMREASNWSTSITHPTQPRESP